MIAIASRLQEWKLVLEGYFDDSGNENEKNNRFVCLAGYLLPASIWQDFMKDWGEFLLLHNLACVHMKTFSGVAKKRNWDAAKRDEVLGDFVGTIRKHRLMGFGVGIDNDAWRAADGQDRRLLLGGSAQELAMMRIVRSVVDKLQAVGMKDDLNLVFDQDEGFCKPRLTRYFAIAKIDPRVRTDVPIISFANAARCYPLQAADILAWETRRRLIERSVGADDANKRFKALMTPLPGEAFHHDWEFIGPDELTANVAEAKAILAARQAAS